MVVTSHWSNALYYTGVVPQTLEHYIPDCTGNYYPVFRRVSAQHLHDSRDISPCILELSRTLALGFQGLFVKPIALGKSPHVTLGLRRMLCSEGGFTLTLIATWTSLIRRKDNFHALGLGSNCGQVRVDYMLQQLHSATTLTFQLQQLTFVSYKYNVLSTTTVTGVTTTASYSLQQLR